MEFITKYSIGEVVHIIYDGTVRVCKVTTIKVVKTPYSRIDIYCLTSKDNHSPFIEGEYFKENRIFKTKKELLESL